MLSHPAMQWRIYARFGESNGYGAKMSPHNYRIPLAESQYHVINPANPGGAPNDGVEHRLHVCGRAADDSEHFGGCGLMLQGLAQLFIALLQLFEQPHVLDGDHRLIGESFQESNLFFGERTDFSSPDVDSAYRNSFSEHRYAKVSSCAKALREFLAIPKFASY